MDAGASVPSPRRAPAAERMIIRLWLRTGFLATPFRGAHRTVRPADWNRMGVFRSASNATGPRSRSRGSSLDVRVPAHGRLRGAWPARDGGPPPNGADPSRDQREPSGSARTSATVDRPIARSSGTLILSSPSMALLHERTPSGQSERGAVGEGLWCGDGNVRPSEKEACLVRGRIA
jgi:hypothetical protein